MDNIPRLMPEIEHYIIYDGTEDPEGTGLYSEIRKFNHNPIKRVLEVRKFAKELDVDVIHAHSSWAGLYSRFFRPNIPVIYEPHCFVFDDPQRHPLIRGIYRAVESFLSKRTAVTIALTEHERNLAHSIDKNATVRILPNIPTIPILERREITFSEFPEITMIGRIAPQKDPYFFLRLAQLSGDRGLPFKFVWIGSGDPTYSKALTEAGVEVTGWLSPEEMSTKLKHAWMYMHSAHYEGFPLSVLDAAAARIPIIVRDLPCFAETQLTKVGDHEEALATLAQAYFEPDFFESLKIGGDQLLQSMNPKTHTDVLRTAYSEASGETGNILARNHS